MNYDRVHFYYFGKMRFSSEKDIFLEKSLTKAHIYKISIDVCLLKNVINA
jgi:hypothetical protein